MFYFSLLAFNLLASRRPPNESSLDQTRRSVLNTHIWVQICKWGSKSLLFQSICPNSSHFEKQQKVFFGRQHETREKTLWMCQQENPNPRWTNKSRYAYVNLIIFVRDSESFVNGFINFGWGLKLILWKLLLLKLLRFKFLKAILVEVVACHNFETDVKNIKENHQQMYTNKLYCDKNEIINCFLKT